MLGYACLTFGIVIFMNAVDIAWHSCAPVVHADAALVLGSAVMRGEPSPVFKGRLATAAELLKSGVVSSLMVSGGAFSEGELSEAEGGARYLRRLGIRADVILLETRARNTRENLVLGAREFSRAGIRTWVVVSDRYHLRRAELLARELGVPFACVEVRTTDTSNLSFLFSEARKVMFMRMSWLITKGLAT